MTDDLLRLAERCEQASDDFQSHHELLREAYEEVFAPLDSFMRGSDDKRRIKFLRCLSAEASLDAAMTLYLRVPERVPSNPRLAAAEALRQRAEEA